jgi:general secretion pathway protein G
MNSRTRNNGFTLLEIIIVVVILGILAAFIVPNIMGRPEQAKVVAAKSDIRTLVSALKMYRLDNGRYPSADQGLKALAEKPTTGDIPANWQKGGYIEHLPKDPWGTDYQYLNPGIHGEIDVFSFGSDGKAGGEGNAADIGNWDSSTK